MYRFNMPSTRVEAKQTTDHQILMSARKLFTAKGYERTTIREIASAADVSVGRVMAFGDKASLLVGIFDEEISLVHTGREPKPMLKTPGGRIAELVRPFLTLFASNENLARLYTSILISGSHTSTVFSVLADKLKVEFISEFVQAGMSKPQAGKAANTAYLAYLGTLFLWASNEQFDEDIALQTFQSSIDYMLGESNA